MKYKLTDYQQKFLRDKRKELKISAEELSERISKSKGWLAQIERGRLKTIKYDDLMNLFLVFYDDLSYQNELNNFLNINSKMELKSEVNVENLINKFKDMANRNSLLVNASQKDLLIQIIGTIVEEAMVSA